MAGHAQSWDQNIGQGSLLLVHPLPLFPTCLVLPSLYLYVYGFQIEPSWMLEISVEEMASQGTKTRRGRFPCLLRLWRLSLGTTVPASHLSLKLRLCSSRSQGRVY